MTIDTLLPEAWPPEVLAALEPWRQGHLLESEKGVWLGPGGVDDPVTGDTASGTMGELRGRSHAFGDTGFMAVVSQTCDISGGPGARHPFVQACPVRNISEFSPPRIEQIKGRESNEYVWLSRPPRHGAEWAVDLRAIIPISKGVLAAATPVEGFASFEDELLLGQRVASKLARPAVHDALGPVFASVRKFLSQSKRNQLWCDRIEQLRLEVMEGTPLQPKRVRLLVLTDTPLGYLDQRPLREEWKSHKKALKHAGIELTMTSFVAVDKCAVSRYRDAIPIDIPTLDRGRWS
ncbi:hypothetical protein [Mycolicibacter sinensis]